MQECYMTDWTV